MVDKFSVKYNQNKDVSYVTAEKMKRIMFYYCNGKRKDITALNELF